MIDSSRYVWTSSGRSEKGNVRQVNEDCFLDCPAQGVWAVADGMGGHDAGDFASRAVIEALAATPPCSRPSALVAQIEDSLSRVNRDLYDRSVGGNPPALCGTTVAVLAVFGAYAACLWAGDSRIYRRHGSVLEQLTRDHSRAQEAADAGRPLTLGANPARNIITRAVGGTLNLALDMELVELCDGDSYLLCSDGLYRELRDSDLEQHLRKAPTTACDALLAQALHGECSDNATAIVVSFKRP